MDTYVDYTNVKVTKYYMPCKSLWGRGWKYMINELHFLQMMRQMHFISFSQFMQNLFVRFSIRLIPNSLRAIIYTKLIR